MKNLLHNLAVAAIISAFSSIPAAVWVGKSYFEAKAYNRVTGANVSVWDAMWVRLMVTNP